MESPRDTTDRQLSGVLLCAGHGLRLRPLTFVRPKALVPLHGIALARFGLGLLLEAGCRRIAVNACHLADQVEAWVEQLACGFPAVEFSCHREQDLLGTGGGLRRMLGELPAGPVLVHNGDVVHDQRLAGLARAADEACLLVQPRPRVLEVDGDRVRSFRDPNRSSHGFAGVHWLGADFRRRLQACDQADLIESYQELLAEGRTIRAHFHDGLWEDLGRITDYLPLHERLGQAGDYRALCDRLGLEPDWDPKRGSSRQRTDSGLELDRSVAWPGVCWTGHAHRSVIATGRPGHGDLQGEILL
jgi:NDP-sugar pyrophosphorylase family protein